MLGLFCIEFCVGTLALLKTLLLVVQLELFIIEINKFNNSHFNGILRF